MCCARTSPVVAADTRPGDVRRHAPIPGSLARRYVSRKIAGSPGGKVESGMTVGIRLNAAVFKSLRVRDASRSVWGSGRRRGTLRVGPASRAKSQKG